ncbi:uncharacterized protein LOC116843412 [Odontomachus brunneus]|uniref:uncharacterized protein LOC116843412 n=1 Tax=Odontomachus brunneus TaxID=486640 RepID=UPI0013F19743|nr:uncharacterized protein LOC116843412 [Odontomachus brunneus]
MAAIAAQVLKVSGPQGHAKADVLAGKMRTLFAGEKEVRIARPAKRVELRVSSVWGGPPFVWRPSRGARCNVRCMQRGHVRATSTSVVDRSGFCYCCGRDGHKGDGMRRTG